MCELGDLPEAFAWSGVGVAVVIGRPPGLTNEKRKVTLTSM
jgi:hypothetical protein